MGDENPIRTLGDYSRPSHEGFRNTIELLKGNNMAPLRSDTIRLVQNGCSSMDYGSISIWEDLSTRFFTQFFPPGRTAKLRNDILMFQQHHKESLSKAWTRFKDLLQKVPHHGIDLWLQVQIFYDHINLVTRQTIDQSAGGKLHDLNPKESWAKLEDLAIYDNKSWNDPRDFAKPVKEITLPQDVPSTSDRRLIGLENQVQRLMVAHLALTQPTHMNKITTPCEISSGPHDTQYFMENPKQAFVEYASSRTDEAGDLGSFVNIIPLYLFKNLKIGLLEETNQIFGLAEGTKSYPVGIVKYVVVHIGKLKLLNDFYILDMKKDPETPLLVGRGFLATANAVIDFKMAKIAVGEGITTSIFSVKGIDLDGIGTKPPYYTRKDFIDCHLPEEWGISRDAELNPFKDTLVFRRTVEFLGAIPINLTCNL
uniref:MAK10-like protein n=1 Tax=Tanacetum cinerariifolium TaxID=118510 RepID=A0A6L2MQK1_TANCI|nr:MAK10-like protein [Tanacetum cinerariifolium]